jgi:hypothetical protein
MKVFEILRPEIKPASKTQIVERMKKFDWKFEFSDDVGKIRDNLCELEVVENLVYQYWKKNPDEAVEMWWKYGEKAKFDRSVTPSFILRLKAQENRI